ncbi:MAG: hypothetical protein OEZ09_13825, partial [Betaproteobacteria bacterium]|nr:hypothetical protein [Betaproteobacteria bacterium]
MSKLSESRLFIAFSKGWSTTTRSLHVVIANPAHPDSLQNELSSSRTVGPTPDAPCARRRGTGSKKRHERLQ